MKTIYLNPLPVRIWHWLNALCFVLLILSGLQIRYSDLFQVLSFRTAIVMHNYVGFVLIANFFLWLGFYLISDKTVVWHQELNKEKYFQATLKQMMYYGYGIFRGEPNPHHPTPYNKFNPMQSMMYQIIMLLLLPLQAITGLLLWDVARFSGIVNALGGLRVIDTVHVLLFIFFSAFIIVHIYLGSLGHTPSAHFKAMITGNEEIPDDEHH